MIGVILLSDLLTCFSLSPSKVNFTASSVNVTLRGEKNVFQHLCNKAYQMLLSQHQLGTRPFSRGCSVHIDEGIVLVEVSLAPGIHIPKKSGMFWWKLHRKSLPFLSPNPAAFQKACQMMTLPPEMLKTTPRGYLNCSYPPPPKKKTDMGFSGPSFLSPLW